uniref:P1-P2 fusion protein n=1 Tax=Kalanchoe marnieriana polerovirus TaxID=2885086 RepID=A0AAD2KQ57_9VIRU
MQILIFVCLFVLFSSSSPIFLEGASTRTDFDRGMGLYPISLNYNWEKSWDTSLKLEVPMTCTCPPPKPICESSYKEISLAFSQKIYADTLKFYSDAQRVLNNSWVCTATTLREIGLEAIDYTLWLLVYVWSSLIWVSLSWIWWLVVNFTTPVFYLASLFVLTKFTVKVVRYVFGGLPVQILKFFWKLLKIIYQTASSKPNCAYEKAVDGFVSYTIPQSPPKSSVLEIVYPSGNHAGYASCIKLYNGENALLTATHVLKASGELLVKSTKMNFKIPLSEFKTIIGNTKGDVTIMRGPPNWEGLLGCKAADIITVRNLAKCKATIFHLRENEWYSSYAEIVGNDGVNVTVLSNTESGHSGSPYFNGKYILGVHSGASVEDNCNFMAPIPAIPGLTMPSYVFETTAPQGKIFSENEIIEIENLYPKVNAWGMTKEDVDRMVNYKPLPGKKRWADEEDKFPEAKPDVSGKRGERRRPRNNRKQLHPAEKRRRYKNTPICCDSCFGHTHSTSDDRPRCFCTFKTCNGGGYECNGENNPNTRGQNKCGGNRKESCGENIHESSQEATRTSKTPAEKAIEFQRYFSQQYEWQVPTATCEVPGFRQSGKLPQFYHPKQKEESEWGKRLIREHPTLGEKTSGFGWPKFGSKAELQSLKLQATRWLERAQSAQIPSNSERERVICKTVETYHPCRTNGPTATRGDRLDWDNFLIDFKQAVFSLELDAGIGVPYIAYGKPTHRSWVEDQALLPVLAKLTFFRLQKMLEVSFEEMTPEELVTHGLCDPIRLFVKGEPHKQSKLDEGRYRLIMSVSLVDQLVARVLFQNQNKREIALWRAIPSKPGFGLSTDEQVREFVESLARQVGTTSEDVILNWKNYLTPTDCSGFDWSVADWMLQDDMIVRNRLTIDLNPTTERLRACWLKCISNSMLCLSDGTLLAQTTPGVQKSGSYNTSSTNSRIRVMAAYHCGAKWAVAMGDDALESCPANLDGYKQLGFKVEVSGQLEFCSHVFKAPDLALPVNANKMLYKLIYGYNPGSGNLEVISNYLAACFSVLNELRHDPVTVQLLYSWLVDPVLPQKNSRE